MPETDKSNAPKAEEPAAKAQAEPAPKQGAHSSAAHGGAYTLVRELTAAGGGQEPPPDKLTPIFRKSEYAHPVNDAQKARALTALQQQYGNRYVQRVLSSGAQETADSDASTVVQRQEAQGSSGGQESSTPLLGQSPGRPLDADTRDSMGARFGQDFGGVRVHDDGEAHRAAKSLNADAFTTGRDIYFSQGAYNPASQPGQKLLAHELAHVVQQNRGAAGAAPQGFSVSHPSDPLERQADAASEAVMRGEMFPALTSSTAPVVHRQAAAPAPAAPAGGAPAAAAGPKDYSFEIAGTTVLFKDLLKVAGVGNKLKVPSKYLKAPIPFFKLTEASLDLDEKKMPTGASVSLAVSKPPLEGTGTVTVDKSGKATGTAHVVFNSSKIPGLKQTELDVAVTSKDFSFDASVDFELPKVTGNLKYKYENQKHSGKGKANYEGAKLKGGIEIIMSEAGLISGTGMLEMELFKGLRGEVEVAVDEKKNIGVKGKLSVPGQVELFPEKKYEKSFFSFEKKFPIWGITIPVIDVNVGIFAEIHAGAGFRAKFGPGVLRDIALTGEFGTDPEAATEFGLGGEFFLPAGAEVVANVGGGIGLGLAVADITGGVEAVGVAGLYSALTVRPNFKYSGGKYTVSGMAEIAGVAQLKFGINAFAKIDVGVWLFKGTVWRKDWTLAEWVWNTGLNIALRANMSYTLGDDFVPDISFETGSVDPEKLIKDVMPESGSPVPAPPKPPVPDKGTLTAEGAQGQQAGAPAGEAPAPPTPAAPPAKTQQGSPGAAGAGGAGGPGAAGGEGPDHTAKVQAGLEAIDREQARYLSNGQILKEEAEMVAAKVKRDHPIFKSLTVVDGDKSWDYDYVASPGKHKKGATKEEKDAAAKAKADAKAKEKEDKAKAKADAKAAAKAEADKAKRDAAAKVIDRYKAKLVGGKVTGEFSDFDFGDYGFQTQPPYHPANVKLKMQTGPAIGPPKTGRYTIGDAIERETGGAEWHKILNGERRDKKNELSSALSAELNKVENKNADEQRKKSIVVALAGLAGDANWAGKVADAGTSLAMLLDQIAMELLGRQYDMPFQDLNLDGWDNHHVWPLDWGGGNDFGNLIFIRRTEHTPITNWWQARKRLLQQSLEALESIPVAPVPAAPGATPTT
ncbi:MAG TPA: DUF4157 domain-containing protein [Pyrinomonadaceae bacterium]|jgi:hypothetical protein